jgi:hypothetical protein
MDYLIVKITAKLQLFQYTFSFSHIDYMLLIQKTIGLLKNIMNLQFNLVFGTIMRLLLKMGKFKYLKMEL